MIKKFRRITIKSNIDHLKSLKLFILTYVGRLNEHNFRNELIISPSLRKPGERSPNCIIPYKRKNDLSIGKALKNKST